MKGPVRLVRSGQFEEYRHLGSLYEWSGEKAYLMIDRVSYRGKTGALLTYYNPPVHQVGNPGLDAYLSGLDRVFEQKEDLAFLLLYGANDPVHAGGDLKESLEKLDRTLEKKKALTAEGASPEEIDRLFDWADRRLEKGIALHGKVRKIARHMRVVAVCGGGTRFGGSAEIPLMADVLVGDSRSGMCFSEAMIGLIPGWGGIARALVKAGPLNAAFMAKTSTEVKAEDLKAVGIYNEVVEVPFPFPRRPRTGDAAADRAAYLEALAAHDRDTGRLLLPRALALAVCPADEIPSVEAADRRLLSTEEEISRQVAARSNPENYAHIRGKRLRDVKDDIARLGRPLAPQSIAALNRLLDGFDAAAFDEFEFVEREMKADAGLYRDARFRRGLVATLEQTVADYREDS